MEINCPDCNFTFNGEYKFDERLHTDVCTCPECEVIFDEDGTTFAADGDDWNEMSFERGAYESDEDYEERMENLGTYAENL